MPNYHLHISSQRRNGHDNRRALLQCSKPLGLFDELYPFFEALTIISLTRALLVPGITPCKAWASRESPHVRHGLVCSDLSDQLAYL